MIPDYIEKRQRMLAFLFSVILLLLINWRAGVTIFPYDSGVYWGLSKPEVFFSFPEHYRGYFFPMVLMPAQWLASAFELSEHHAFRIYASLVYAFFIAVVVPAFYSKVFGGRLTFARRAVFCVLVTLMFPGLFIYPLSDMPALAMLIGAILLIEQCRQEPMCWRKWGRLVVAGFLIYGAYNTRTIYFFSVPFFVAMAVWRAAPRRDVLQKTGAILALAMGMIVAAAPQSIINHRHGGSYSPLLNAQSSEDSLFGRQLIWGLSIQRYSTMFDPETEIGSGLYSVDPVGMKLFDDEQITEDDAKLRSYLSLVLEHPFHFIGIYTRHLVNGLDIRDGEVYLRDASQHAHGKSLLGFLILFMAVWVVYAELRAASTVRSEKTRRFVGMTSSRLLPALGWLTVILLPVAAIVPGAIETRFFLGLHCLAYMVLAFTSRPSVMVDNFQTRWRSVCVIFVITLLVFNTISFQSIVLQQRALDPKYMLLN